MVDVRFDIWMCEVAHLPPRRILEAREHFGTAEQACRLANTPEGEAFLQTGGTAADAAAQPEEAPADPGGLPPLRRAGSLF